VLRSRKARGPSGYRKYDNDMVFSYASRTMVWGGVIILGFVVYHLMHLTTGNAHPDFIPGNAYHNFVAGFQSVPVSLAYIAHHDPARLPHVPRLLEHAPDAGREQPEIQPRPPPDRAVLAMLVVLGNISFPVAVLAGIVGVTRRPSWS
jgi:succinate dehydrogenase / fumarate reductase, cytochrome b subunit